MVPFVFCIFFHVVVIDYESNSCFTIIIVADYGYSCIFFHYALFFFSLSFVSCIASIVIFLSHMVVAMFLYLDFLFEYLFPFTLSDAIFHKSILLVGVVVIFSLVICLWGSSVTPSVAEPLQAVVEMALTVVFWGLELWVDPRLMGSFVFILLLHVPEEADGVFTPVSPSVVSF